MDLHCTSSSSLIRELVVEGNIAHCRTRSYAMLQKCLVCCKNPLKRCKNALNMLQKFRNFTTHILIIIVIILIIKLLLLCVLSLLLIYFNNFCMILFRFISFFFIYYFVSTLFSLVLLLLLLSLLVTYPL